MAWTPLRGFLLTGFGFVSAILCWFRLFRTILFMTVTVVLLSIPQMELQRQVVLSHRLHNLRIEVTRIADYVETYKSRIGDYPRDLAAYVFSRPVLADYIVYFLGTESDGYWIDYHPIKNDTIQHWYNPKQGWGFYDD